MTISAVLVVYKPNYNLLKQTIKSIHNQVTNIIIINNDSCDNTLDKTEKITYINLKNNYGIAYAQNRGIEKAQELGSEYILFSDQDTIYPESFVDQMISVNNYSENIICPVFFDSIKNEISPIMLTKFTYAKNIENTIYVSHAISSGTIIRTEILDDIGLMDESLFIDYVDFEWCWRAIFKGYRILVNPFVKISHQLGDGYRIVFRKKVTLRSNQRYYYIIRNGFYLSFYSSILRKYEKILLLKRTITFTIGILLLEIGLFPVLKKAFFDALYKRMGKGT